YLDGDEMGQVFDQVKAKDQAKAFSRAIETAARETIMRSLAKYLHPAKIRPSDSRIIGTAEEVPHHALDRGRVRIHPFEIITIGGDDLILIVPAHIAIPLACEISQTFQKAMHAACLNDPVLKPLASKPYTLSGGVVLADDHNPVQALQDLASALKSSAKQAHYTDDDKNQNGHLDFIALMGTDLPERDLEQSRDLYPHTIAQPGLRPRPLSLLGRPYRVSQLADAWNELVALKAAGFANTQMALLAQALLKGVQQSGLFYEYQRARGKPEAFAHLEAAMRSLQNIRERDIEIWKIFPDYPLPEFSARTVLWDIAELYSLVWKEG
ncbi:MAG: hypothetical protein ABIG63_09770, partial [Chloroflexota bacterium]